MQELRANTEIKVRVGQFVDVGDGFTPQIDITLAGDEAELLKHNGVATVDISGNTWAAIASCRGWYDLTLTSTDTNTEGLLTVVVQDDSDCLPVHRHFMVLSEAAWDSKYAAKDDGFMDVNVKTETNIDFGALKKTSLNAATPIVAKILTNKLVQNKSTGVVQYYDDDGETVILTLTPTDSETTFTRTPS